MATDTIVPNAIGITGGSQYLILEHRQHWKLYLKAEVRKVDRVAY